MKKIYLAGGWSPWRDQIIKVVGNSEWLDPRIAHCQKTEKNLSNWFEIETDMLKDDADALICYIKKDNPSGFGTTFEMGMAYSLNKPYILINEKDEEYKWDMQTKGAVKVFKNIDDALQWIKKTGWMELDVSDYDVFPEGTPCTHKGCWSHRSHDCECCGRKELCGDGFVLKTREIC